MPSELQRVARGLVDCFDEVPRVVEHLIRTAARCRENAQLALLASRGQATVAAQQLDAAARACEAAAHFLSMAPPKARAWAEGLIGDGRPSVDRPSSGSADRNRATGGVRDIDSPSRRRLTFSSEELETAEEGEPPVVSVARKVFEAYRKAHAKDDDEGAPEALEIEITVSETGELVFEEPDKKEEEKRAERLTRDFELVPEAGEVPEYEERDENEDKERAERLTRDFAFDAELTEAVKALLDSMTEPDDQQWNLATITITADQLEATLTSAEPPRPAPIVVDFNLPDLPTLGDLDFDPALDLRPLGDKYFGPGVFDPGSSFDPQELVIAQRLAEEGWRLDARRADHGNQNTKNPDVTVRKSGAAVGVIVEFKTPTSNSNSALKRNMNSGSTQAGRDGELVVDGRLIRLTEQDAFRAFRRACGQPGTAVAKMVHVILGDGRMVTYSRES
ncbi:hypothetical protein [Kribbella sp. NPDC048915]|uniref:hypothetical protein n=1 Tax=Kribbella sp. NPDC048915 TaxID=3155148 RepID=UPI0033D954A5